MEPVTHFLTGACIGRAGFNRRTAYATVAATLAAEAADLDILWSFRGPVSGLAHHRGITHTLLGAPVVALAITGLVWLIHRSSRAHRKPDAQPIRWFWVWLTSFIAALSHIALDWTNNYGVRPFFPFNSHWYSGDLVFIAEPVIWGLLVLALLLPAILGLADREVGASRTLFRGRGWAAAALTGIVLLWCWRWAEHASAYNLVAAADITPSPVTRIAIEPYPTNPWRWHALLETASTWQVAEVDTRTGAVVSDSHVDALFKPTRTPSVNVARNTYLGEVYLDWSQWPVVREIGQQPAPGMPAPDFPPTHPWVSVEFSDLRFAYSYLDTSMTGRNDQSLDHMLAHSGLTGWVYVLDSKEEAGQFMNAREQK